MARGLRRIKECGTKRQYTKDEAEKACKRLERTDGARMHWYKCSFCPWFHVAHTRKARTGGRRGR